MYRFGMGARSKFFWSIFLMLKKTTGMILKIIGVYLSKNFLGIFFDIKKP